MEITNYEFLTAEGSTNYELRNAEHCRLEGGVQQRGVVREMVFK
jgi:hypothetical protein